MTTTPAEPDPTVTAIVDDLLVEANIDPAEASTVQRAKLTRWVRASMSKVLLFLNRESFETYPMVLTDQWRDDRWDADDFVRAWPGTTGMFPDRAQYVSHTLMPGETDLFEVTFRIGLSLDSPGAGAIRDYIIEDVYARIPGDHLFPDVERLVTSVSGGGQSVSFEKRAASPDAAGGQLTIGTLARFKRYAVGVSPTTSRAPFPYGGGA